MYLKYFFIIIAIFAHSITLAEEFKESQEKRSFGQGVSADDETIIFHGLGGFLVNEELRKLPKNSEKKENNPLEQTLAALTAVQVSKNQKLREQVLDKVNVTPKGQSFFRKLLKRFGVYFDIVENLLVGATSYFVVGRTTPRELIISDFYPKHLNPPQSELEKEVEESENLKPNADSEVNPNRNEKSANDKFEGNNSSQALDANPIIPVPVVTGIVVSIFTVVGFWLLKERGYIRKFGQEEDDKNEQAEMCNKSQNENKECSRPLTNSDTT